MVLNFIIIVTWSRLIWASIICRSNSNSDMFFKFWQLWYRVIITWSCSGSTFLWVDWWPQTKLILGFFYNFTWDLVIKRSRVFDCFWSGMSINSINWPKLLWMFFCSVNVISFVCSWAWNISNNFWIDKFGLYKINE